MPSINDIYNIEFDVEVRPPEAGPVTGAFHQMGAAADGATAQFNATTQATAALGDALLTAGNSASAGDASWRRLMGSINPYAGEVDRLQGKLAQLNRLHDQSRGTQEGFAQATRLLTGQIGEASAAAEHFNNAEGRLNLTHGQSNFILRTLGREAVGAVSALAAGAPVMSVLADRAAQLTYEFTLSKHGIEFVREAFGSLLGPVGMATSAIAGVVAIAAAVAGAFVVVGVSAEKQERQLLALQTAISGTHENYRKMAEDAQTAARAVAAATTATRADAVEAAKTITSAPEWAGTEKQLERVLTVSNDAAAVMGIKFPEAAKKMADGLHDPARLAQELADRGLFGFNQQMVRSIELQAKSGDTGEAWGRILDQIQQKSVRAGDQTTEIQKAMKQLDAAFQELTGSGRTFGDAIGHAFQSAAATAIQMVAEFIKAIHDLGAAAKSVVTSPTAGRPVPTFDESGQAIPLSQGPLGQQQGLYQQQIRDAAAARNLSQQDTDFALRLAQQESQFQQFDPRGGGVYTSPKGAQGLFQLEPGTARDVGVNAADAGQNIQGGLSYIAKLRADPAFGGDPALVAMAYNWGPGNTKEFLSGVKTLGDVPNETKNFVLNVAGKNVSDIQVPASQSATASGARGGVDIDRAVKEARALGSNADAETAAQAQANVVKFTAALDQLRVSGKATGDQVDVLTNALAKSTYDFDHARDSTLKDTEALQDQTKVLSTVGQGQRDVQQVLNEAAQAARSDKPWTDEQFTARLEAVSQKQTAALKSQTAETEINTEASKRMAAGWADGADAAERMTAHNKAAQMVQEALAGSTHDTAGATAELEKILLQQMQAQDKATVAETRTKDLQGAKIAASEKEIRTLEQLRKEREAANDPAGVANMNAAIAKQREELQNIINPWRQETQAMEDAAKATLKVGQGDRELIELQQRAVRARQGGEGPNRAQEAAAVQELTNKQTAAFAQQSAVLDINIEASNKQAAAWEGGAAAAAKATATAAAHKQTMDTLATSTHDVAAAEADRTQKLLEQAAAQERVKGGQELSQLRDQVALYQEETRTLGEDADARALEIQHLQDEMDIRRQYPNAIAAGDTALISSIQAQRDAVAQSKQALEVQQRNLDYVAGQFSSAFDTIGNAMAQAFVQGQGQAVNWGNTMKAVAEQVLQAFIRLAFINPLINSLFGGQGGQSLPTIGSVFGAIDQMGGGGGAVGGGGGGFGGIMPVMGLAGQATGLTDGGGLMGGGATSGGGLFGNLGLGNLFSPINSLLATPLWGGAAAGPLFGPATAGGVAATGVTEPGLATNLAISNMGWGGGGAVTLGSLLGGVGAGFGLGSMAGGILQKSLGKTGPGPMIGAGVGALGGIAAGAAMGSVVPIIGTIIGAIAGGLLGGAIGPKPPSPFQASFLGFDPGTGRVISNPALSGNQLMPSNVQAVSNDAIAFNQQMMSLGVRINSTQGINQNAGPYGLGFFGSAKNAAGLAGASLSDVMGNIRFGAASDAGMSAQTIEVMNRALDRSFSSFDELGKEVNKVRTFMEQTVPTLRRMADGSSSLNDALVAIDQQYNPAIQTAKELGYAEDELTAARQKAIDKAWDAANYQMADQQAQFAARYSAAAAKLSTDPQVGFNAVMEAADLAANEERKRVSDSLLALRGDSYKQTQEYADQMAGLERTLGEERLATAKQANDAIVAADKQAADQRAQQMDAARNTASQLVTSIAEYARGLQHSAASPLSPRAQLESAQRDFNAVSGASAAGDFQSMQKLTAYSDTLLAAARSVYGSGQGYADIFRSVTETLAKVSEVSPDTLTASILATEVRSQTASLLQALTDLQNEVKGLRAQVAAGSSMPSRLAA